MKTITEFAASTLKNAAKTQQELLAANKTAEEMPQAMGEALKLEGDKLNFLLSALEVVGDKANDLKRVVVLSLSEGEKAPHKALQKGENYFVAEYYLPESGKQKPVENAKSFDGKGKGRGKRGDKKEGRRGKPRGEHSQEASAGRAPRPPRKPMVHNGPLPVITPKSATTASAPVAPAATTSETPANS
jgi:hypothetical protein